MSRNRIDIVVGGQYGSEAKGHVCEILAHQQKPGTVNIRVGGPNAGHTVYDEKGVKYPFRHIPVSAVINDNPLFLAPGSEIDIDVLADEIALCESNGHRIRGRLFVSPQATVIASIHKEAESLGDLRGKLGSTAKGIGAARADRLWRNADIVATRAEEFLQMGVKILASWDGFTPGRDYLIEGTQGYGLGLHAGHYPFCTAGDCRNVDFLAQSGLPMSTDYDIHTWVTYRTFPIRVAGNSGFLFEETTWEQLGEETGGYIQPERTTVTKLVRRVGRWDRYLAHEALMANGGPTSFNVHPVLSFVDYLDPKLEGASTLHAIEYSPAWETIRQFERDLGAPFHLLLTGPRSHTHVYA